METLEKRRRKIIEEKNEIDFKKRWKWGDKEKKDFYKLEK